MNAALCTAATGDHKELWEVARPSFEKYADTFDMDMFVDPPTEFFKRPTSWFKILRLQTVLDAGFDTAIWVDADAQFVAFDRNILKAAPRSHALWVVEHKVEGRDYLVPNCGVMVVHQSPRLTKFFDLVWQRTDWLNHPWWEQAAILDLLGWTVEPPGGLASPGGTTEWTDLVGFLGTEWNSMRYDPHPDPVIKHYTGRRLPERLAEMRADA